MSDSFEELKRRCEGARLRYEEDHENEALVLHFPRGRGEIEVIVGFDEEARQLLRQPFEMYKGIEGFEATWSPEQGVIECNLLWPSWHPSRVDARVLRHLGADVEPQQKVFTPDQRAEFSTSIGLSVSIGPCSDIHGILLYPMDFMDFNYAQDPWRTLTIRIEGASVGRHDDAVELLRRVADSTFFHLDISLGVHLTLERNSGWRRGNATLHNGSPGTGRVREIRNEYDHQPMSLYWHGKKAEDMPLLQFLSFYQVLEFYFAYYSGAAAAEALQNILNESTFDRTSASDISRLLTAIRVNTQDKGFGPEVEQLEATIRRCVSVEDLEGFFLSGGGFVLSHEGSLVSGSDDRYGFYTSKRANRIVREPIPLQQKSGDILGATARRIYAIRNRIVHTKGSFGDQESLFPFDPEVKYLSYDLYLAEFLARKVLIASSRPLRV